MLKIMLAQSTKAWGGGGARVSDWIMLKIMLAQSTKAEGGGGKGIWVRLQNIFPLAYHSLGKVNSLFQALRL